MRSNVVVVATRLAILWKNAIVIRKISNMSSDELLHQLLAGHQCCASQSDDWSDDYVELLHYDEWFSFHSASGLQPDRHESVGRRVHVFHLRLHVGIYHRQLPLPETSRSLWYPTRIGAGARVPQKPVPCPGKLSFTSVIV
ncbi:hypothetical protein TNCV_622181 [Trichonephila clavipes]|nr:hypothetical protein TNCV_622181 [Trichonephila clavipes]